MSLAEEVRTIHHRVAARLRELEPLVREYHELKQLAAELGLEQEDRPPSPEPQAPTRQPRPRRSTGGTRRAPKARSRTQARPASASSDLSERVVEAVRADPGRTVADYATTLGVAPTALYRPIRQLATAGRLVKRARHLYPA